MNERIEAIAVEDVTYTGLMCTGDVTTDDGLVFTLIPVGLTLDIPHTGGHMQLRCYADGFTINGEPAADAEVIAFLKKLASGYATWMSAQLAKEASDG